MYRTSIIALAGVITLSGCQTMQRGSSETVKIFATPSTAKITTSLGHTCKSPCELKIKRRHKFSVTASHPNYQTQTVEVGLKRNKKSVRRTIGSAVVPGGSVLVATDLITKANFDHTPNPVRIKLKRRPGS
jgi:hypothetical protein